MSIAAAGQVAPWIWVPITIGAAFAQTLRNAAQRSLIQSLGTLGATLVRFLYGLPFTCAWAAVVLVWTGSGWPGGNLLGFAAWLTLGSITQIAGTALLLKVMAQRSFAVGIVYSNTELVQVAVFGLVFLGDPLTLVTVGAILCATVGVVLVSMRAETGGLRGIAAGFRDGAALLGLASGCAYGLAAVGFRGAALSLDGVPLPVAAALALVGAQSLQTVLLGSWLLVRNPKVVAGSFAAWRVSLTAGLMGATASAGWFTAMAMEPVARVRTLGAIEILFALALSRRLFKERLTPPILAGIALIAVGVVLISTR